MTTPPKKLSFAEEMELLKKQKAQEAEHAKAAAALRRQELAAKQQLRAAPQGPVDDSAANGNAIENKNASDTRARLDSALAGVVLTGGAPAPLPPPMRAIQASTTPVLLDDERQLKIKAMEAAFAKLVGEHQPKSAKSKKGKTDGAMLFCTSCHSTTPGEHVKPGNAGIGLALGLIGFIPGIAYFFYRQMGTAQQCTHCQATTLVAMNSVQARTLCGDQHTELMAAGWPEMRRAERNHIRNRRIAMAKIMVVGVVLLGASLYFLRAPATASRNAMGNAALQELRTMDQVQQQEGAN